MHLIYYGRDGEKAKMLAAEKAERIVILPCVAEYDVMRIERAYPDIEIDRIRAGKVVPQAKPSPPPQVEKPTVMIDKTAPAAKVDDKEAARRGGIEIPDGWETLPFMSKRALARNIAGNNEPSKAAEVDTTIAGEVARRKV